MSAEARKDVVRYWWAKAEESLASAHRELDAGSYTFAVNRLYYAAFYGVSAALLDRHLSFSKHSGVRAVFHRELIKTGQLDLECGRFYDQAYEDRQEGDYVALSAFDRTYVESQLDRCARFLFTLRSHVSSLSTE